MVPLKTVVRVFLLELKILGSLALVAFGIWMTPSVIMLYIFGGFFYLSVAAFFGLLIMGVDVFEAFETIPKIYEEVKKWIKKKRCKLRSHD